MSLTITQANAVNVIVDHLTGKQTHKADRPSRRQALEAAQVLVPGAYKALGAGWTPQELQAHIGLNDADLFCDQHLRPLARCHELGSAHVAAVSS